MEDLNTSTTISSSSSSQIQQINQPSKHLDIKINMFDLQSGDELSFVINSITQQEDDHKLSLDDLISDQPFLGCNIIPTSATSGAPIATRNQRLIEFGVQESQGEKRNHELNNIRKDELHRDLERRRRHEMANLYASLRSLLPFECIKGKRSISDHMHEAVIYIEKKKKKIQDLKTRRDRLKSDSSENEKHSIMVNAETRGVEILISTCSENHVLRISTVFVELVERGLNVVSWVSTKANGKFFHKIQAESIHETCIDPSILQEKLECIINN